ncbi:MAG TPA: NACHT domain-containing protein [Pyrinomonadaceae bacterium]|nr:NACHT domain-containing protein [Pyrinomonadaceae bacterium]
MQIIGMAAPVPLDDIFTEAYLLDKPSAFSRHDIERLIQQRSADPDAPPSNAERVGGLALVKRNVNFFILGKPGAGKTTFLKYIAVQATEPRKPLIDKVPIFVSLKEWSDSGLKLMPFILERFEICGFPDAQRFVEELLKSGNAIALFDGLDEVNQEGGKRDEQTRAINNFVEKYDRTQCLITCRIAASDYSFEPFVYVEVADFTETQIEQFVGHWFRREGEKDEETCRRFLTEFKKEENKGLRDMARTPLLLTLLCLAFNETMTFPQRRVEIYKEALDALLKKWDSSRRIKRDEVYRKLSLGHKENMFARIAAETFEGNEYFIPQDRLEKLIADFVRNVPPHDENEAPDGEKILKAIEERHGIFVERTHRIYSFSHLTFQEYFTAKYVVDNAAKGTLKALIKDHCADERWREVFLLTTSMLPDAGEFMRTFRRYVDEFLGDEKLRDLFVWADNKSASIVEADWRVRWNYLFAGIYYGLRNFDRTLARALDLALARDRDLALARDLAFAFDRAFDRARAFASAIASALDRARGLAGQMGLHELAGELDAISIPTYKDTDLEWQEFADNLRALMIKHRGISHDWKLTKIQGMRLADYFNAARLLRDCLELAYMSPDEKNEILNSLYLPPLRRLE